MSTSVYCFRLRTILVSISACVVMVTWARDLASQLSYFAGLQRRDCHVDVGREKMSFRKQTPSEFLKQIIGKPVVVKLNSGVDYRGAFKFK